jgi:acyl-CoA synthetase (NDP forming)
VTERATTASSRVVEALLAPRSIAVVGASPTSFVGRVALENLELIGFKGPVYPINPRYGEILGRRCYPGLDALPEPPDAVVAALRIDRVPAVLREAAAMGSRAAVVPGGGFSESGEAATIAQAEIAEIAAEHRLAVAGPNCMGVIAPGRSAMYIGTLTEHVLPGRVAVVSQSGSVIEAMVNMGPRVGFSALISSGVEAGTTTGDYLRYFADDERTFAVCVFMEGFRDPAAFVDGARALRAAGKPLVVLQAGRHAEAAAAIAAHSGTLATADEVLTGLLHQLGAIGVEDLDEMIECAELLGHGRLPTGRRFMAVTDSGGEAQLIGDHARAVGFEVPVPSDAMKRRLQTRWPNFSFIGNPVDPWGVDPDFAELYAEILDAMSDEDVDILAVGLDKVTTWMGANEVDLGESAARSLIEAVERSGRFGVFFTLHGMGPAHPAVRDRLREAGIPLLHGLRPAMVAMRRAWYWNACWRPRTAFPDSAGPAVAGHLAFDEPGSLLSERASRAVLAAYGVPLVRTEVATNADDAGEVASRVGFPVVMKADVAGVAHKAAAGLVRVGVNDRLEARRAHRELIERAAAHGRRARGTLVQETARGIEVICGMRRDPQFGPVVLLGAGGTLTEVLHDVTCRVAPVSPEDLEEMLEECAVGRMLSATETDPSALKGVVRALSELALDDERIAEVDANPVFVDRDGSVRAADALVVLGG